MLRKTFKKISCIVLSTAMVFTGKNINMQSLNTMDVTKKGVTKVFAAEAASEITNLLENPSFDTDTSGWYITKVTGEPKCEFINAKGHDNVGGYVKISNRAESWNSLAQDITEKVENHVKYNFSVWVKLGEDYPVEEFEIKVGLTTQSTGDNGGSEAYGDGWELSGNTVMASKNEWREIKGSFTANWTGDLKKVEFKVADGADIKYSLYVDDLSVTKAEEDKPDTPTPPPVEEPTPELPPAGTNLLENPTFAKETESWFSTEGKLEIMKDKKGHDETGDYIKIYDRTQSWGSLAQNIEKKVGKGKRYKFSVWVKLGDDYKASESTVKVGLTTRSTGDNKGEPEYDKWGISSNTITASKEEWREIKGSFTANWTNTLEEVQFKVADETPGNTGYSLYVDNLSLIEANVSIQEEIPSLKEVFQNEFKVGAAVGADVLANENKMKLVKKHYNSVTATNEMKPDAIIKGINEDGSLKLDFTTPDKMLDYFQEYNEGKEEKDKIYIRGHVLCWHSQTPDFFFKDKEGEDGKLLDKEAMKTRLKTYIEAVIDHVEEKYPGLVYCWDVVNEAIIPEDGEKGGLRVYNGGKETFYHQIYKDSNEYIISAFKYATEHYKEKYPERSETVKFFYNDYGETNPTKVECICNLADAIQKENVRIDGIGMQSHHSVEAPSAEELYNAITAYGKHVKEVQITELDILASKSYDGSDKKKKAEQIKEAYRYKEMVDAILKAKKDGTNITALVFWGVADDDSWLVTDEFSDGRHNMPLLFDEELQAKYSYWAIVDPKKLPPNLKEAAVLQNGDKNWTLADPIEIGTDGNSFMKLLWNHEKLYVQVTVKDASNDKDDCVTLYLDKNNVKANNVEGVEIVPIKRTDAKATSDGYVVEKEFDISGKGVNSEIGFDVVVLDASTKSSQYWNDSELKQKERSEYYGTLLLKPFMTISKGSAKIDAEIDDIWKNIEAHDLTIKSNPSDTTGKVKILWDEDALYVLAEIKDNCLNKDHHDSWEQDSFEIFVDENNGKTDTYEDDDCQYRINYDNELAYNGTNCKKENIESATKKTENGYIVEAKIKFNTFKGKENNLIGIEFQINDADASGRRVSAISWYDASGMGYAQPAVFGTGKLIAVSDTPGGNTPGGNTPGGNTPGGNTPGGTTPGGTTSSGTASGSTNNTTGDKTIDDKIPNDTTSNDKTSSDTTPAKPEDTTKKDTIVEITEKDFSSAYENQNTAKNVVIDINIEEGVEASSIILTSENVTLAKEKGKKVTININGKDINYTVIIPAKQLKKISDTTKPIDIMCKTIAATNLSEYSAKRQLATDLSQALSASGGKQEKTYVLSMAENPNLKAGMKIIANVDKNTTIAANQIVYVYKYNKNTGKFVEVANSKQKVSADGKVLIDTKSGTDYVVSSKKLSGNKVKTIKSQISASVAKSKIKTGKSTKIKVSLPSVLKKVKNFSSSSTFGKEQAKITYKSSNKKIAVVTEEGKVKVKKAGKVTITTIITMESGQTKKIKNTITVK